MLALLMSWLSVCVFVLNLYWPKDNIIVGLQVLMQDFVFQFCVAAKSTLQFSKTQKNTDTMLFYYYYCCCFFLYLSHLPIKIALFCIFVLCIFIFTLLAFCEQQMKHFFVQRKMFLYCAYDIKHFESWIFEWSPA